MSNYTLQDIAALKERRKLSRITMRELYEAAGLRCTQYAKIEGGRILPTAQEWHAIDTAFYAIDAQRALAEGKWIMSGSEHQTDARRKLAKWNAAVSKKGNQ